MQMEVYNPGVQQQFNEEQLSRLNQPLQATRIKERKGFGGKMLKYLKADDVIGVANEIFGYGRWGYKVVARGEKTVEDPKKGGPIYVYTCDIELSVLGCPFPFPGDGFGIVNDPYTVEMHEKARKESTSDSIKRALRHYGDQFGLCLYDEDDIVEQSDGTLTTVKNAKKAVAPQPKRVVDSSLPDETKSRLNKYYSNLLELELFKQSSNKQENVVAFFMALSEITGVKIASPVDMTPDLFKIVEQHIGIEIEKRLGVFA